MSCSRALLAISGFLVVPLLGREVVHLATGFDLNVASHVASSSFVILTTDSGTLELPRTAITGIDVIPDPPKAALLPAIPAKQDLTALIEAAAASQAGSPEFCRFVRSVAQVESALKQSAVSPKGAIGLMQLMPATAKGLGVVATDVQDNVKGGARYLRDLLIRYNNDSVLALAAYNAGPGAVAKYGGVPPFLETRRYIGKVLQEYARNQPAIPQTTARAPAAQQ